MHSPWAGGLLLVLFAALAMALANIPRTAEWYRHMLEIPLSIGFDGWKIDRPVETWINDGLMAIFFFAVGLEIKREIASGQLSGMRRAALPLAAALGGMIVPSSIYALLNLGGPTAAGWGVPMATDIAFALGVLSLMGNRVPLSLKIFLTALAIVDDLGSILVIALFYSSGIDTTILVAAVAVFAFMLLLNRLNVYKMRYYLVPGIALWILFLHSGVHATIAGVLVALTIPATPRFSKRYFSYKTRFYLRSFEQHDREGEEAQTNPRQLEDIETIRLIALDAISPSQRLEYALHHTVAFFIMPAFALANAGVRIDSLSALDVTATAQGLGIVLGLVAGKPIGIFLFSHLAVRAGWCSLPDGVSWRALFGVACLGGIGFTMSIFINNLAFADSPAATSGKIAVLVASLVAVLAGILTVPRRHRTEPTADRRK